VDKLAARLLASQAGEDQRLADRTTSSLPALRSYLQGQAAYRAASYTSAMRNYARALELDPGFALAALRLAVTADRLNDVQQQRRALATAWSHRSELDERELAHLLALAGPRYPDASPAAEQLAAWEQLVVLAPDRAEAWYELGARLFRDGATLGIADSHQRALVAFQRSLAVDPTFQLARQFLLQLGAQSVANAGSSGRSVLASDADSLGPLAPFIRWRLALSESDSAVARHLGDTIPELGPVNLRTIAMASAFDGIGLADGRTAAEALLRRSVRTYEEMDAELALHSLALIEGRPAAALERTARMASAEPGTRTHLRMRVLDAIYAEGDSSAARLAAGELARLARGERVASSTGAVRPTDLCILAQWRLSQADTSGISEIISRLRTPGFDDSSAYLNAPARLCADLIDAALVVQTRGAAALAQIQRLDALALSAAVAADLSNYAHLWIARMYRSAGEPGKALAAVRRRPYMAGWPRYLASAWREEGALAEATGDRAGALRAYQRFLSLRAAPEQQLAGQVAEIRARRDSLR
jgi:tetratricopeptide (TPR) repeat protein